MAGIPETTQAFTGRTRDRRPRRSVKIIDKAAQSLITVGGVGSIVAVSMVGVFLVWVAAPLFFSPSVDQARELAAEHAPGGAAAVPNPDEYLTAAWSWTEGWELRVRDLHTGGLLETRPFPASTTPTCWADAGLDEQVVFGFADGTVRFGELGFATEFRDFDALPAEYRAMNEDEALPLGAAMVQRTPENQFRLQSLAFSLQDSVPVSEAPVVRVDLTIRPSGPILAALDSAGVVALRSVRTTKNIMTGDVKTRLRGGGFAIEPAGGSITPDWMLLDGQGANLYAAWRDGTVQRYDTGDLKAPVLAETVDLSGPAGPELTALSFQVGKSSLIAGDADGGVTAWYLARAEGAAASDGKTLRPARVMPEADAAVTVLDASNRSRLIAAGYADGTARLFHVTNERRLAELPLDGIDGPVAGLVVGPRDDAVLAVGDDVIVLQRFDAPHPEAGLDAILLPVWYEGYDGPAQVWQSSAGTDDFEPKYGLMPLIFGTLKATFYTMLFGLPLALLAAVFTSEFLDPRVKARIKPTIELMASLPSVVLGFLAALVFAPFIEDRVPFVLASMFTGPFMLLLGAHLWQLLPGDFAIRNRRWKLPAIFVFLPLGVLTARGLADPLENLLFAGDLGAWLTGRVGSGVGGWAFALLPICAVGVARLTDRYANPILRGLSREWSRTRFAVADLVKFLLASLAVVISVLTVSWLLTVIGFDPRGSFLGTYVQRNALVVGFVMGFAVIPIIYTIAEDALSAVPDHLRAASLGAGATPWQTAVRVVIPPAASGLFSAMMIGLGRAVGETMIVLMAAGNTPIMEMNIFNGFRTLSANIAVELPEAVQNSTHFRMLFLAALALFAMTFVLNTAAEIVRMRFRRKAYQL